MGVSCQNNREGFMIKLKAILRKATNFEALHIIETASFMLGCEHWTKYFDALLALVKEYITNVWEIRKVKLYGELCSSQFSLGPRLGI